MRPRKENNGTLEYEVAVEIDVQQLRSQDLFGIHFPDFGGPYVVRGVVRAQFPELLFVIACAAVNHSSQSCVLLSLDEELAKRLFNRNRSRLHQSLDCSTPDEVYFGARAAELLAAAIMTVAAVGGLGPALAT